jgi:gliding motility-associated-like protein
MKTVMKEWRSIKEEGFYFHSSILPWLLIAYCLLPTAYSSYGQFTITAAVANVTCPGGADGSASVSVSGGNLPYTYQWSPDGQTISGITGLTAGSYSVGITDNSGNDSTISITVSEPQPFADHPTISNPECTNNGYIAIFPSGGTAPYQFLWNTGSVITGIINIAKGDYSVVVTDAANCSVTFSYTLMEKECFVTPGQYFTPNDDGIHDTWYISNSQYFPDAKLIVFDRWGTRVYEHKGTYEPWDGKSYLGIPVPDAVYYYFFYQDKNDTRKASKSGSVTILR